MSLLAALLRLPDSKRVSEISTPSSPTPPQMVQIAPTVDTTRVDTARSLIRTCKEYGIGLRLEHDGTVVVESNGKAWRALVRDLEKNVEPVAELILLGWDGTDT